MLPFPLTAQVKSFRFIVLASTSPHCVEEFYLPHGEPSVKSFLCVVTSLFVGQMLAPL